MSSRSPRKMGTRTLRPELPTRGRRKSGPGSATAFFHGRMVEAPRSPAFPLSPLLRITAVINPASRRPQLDYRERKQDNHEKPRQGRAVAHLEVLEGLIVDVQGQKPGRVARPTFGRDVGHREDLHRPDDAEDEV